MKFRLEILSKNLPPADCAIIGVYEEGELTPTTIKFDQISHGHIKSILKYGEFLGKIGQTLMIYQLPHGSFSRVLLVGCGKKAPLSARHYRKVVGNSIKALNSTSMTSAIFFLTELEVESRSLPWKIKQAVESIVETTYRFHQFKTTREPLAGLSNITLPVPKQQFLPACEKALAQALGISKAVAYTKDIANLPSNICTPIYLAAEAKKLAKLYKSISVEILDAADMKKLGMNALLAVAQGSSQPPQLVCIQYKGKSKQAPVALVGKGITFDTGGISLKSPDSLIGMKYDMCGAATVMGTLKAAAELKLPLNIVGILAVAENMPGGAACKPEDIVTGLSGQTIEILNTDAEGRLVLSDALTYVERYKPEVVIDIATLTGAVVIALGHHASGLLSNDETLAKDLLEAGTESHDRAWQLPLWEEYQEQLKSPYADMSNVGGRAAGTITAACFLSRFTKNFRWAHLDVAGTAAMMMNGSERYATGRPVPLLTQYLINRCDKT